ncbi:MAG: lysophospholipase [Candidatus Tantalella remota]|nr:lysophospholipase [Candidatus Tantalella remota]
MIRTDKNTGIIYRQWDRPDPEAAFLLVHGLGAHAGRWRFLADFFLKNGISSYALELRGFGETEGIKGHIDYFDTYFEDIRALRSIIARENPGKKIYLVGESLGALISFLTVAEEDNIFNGLICLAPAFKARPAVSAIKYLKIAWSVAFDPKKHFKMPFNSAMCTRDEEYRKIMDADDREHRVATARFLFKMITAQTIASFEKGKIDIPSLFLLAGKDKLVVNSVTKRMFNGLQAEDKTIIEYPEMFHALSIDLGKEQVFKDILKWVQGKS